MPETIKLISKTIPTFEIYQARAQNQLRIKCIQGQITKLTQNQVYSRQKLQNQLRIKCIQAKISITYQGQKNLISKTIPQPQMHWQNNNKHSFKIVTNNLTL